MTTMLKTLLMQPSPNPPRVQRRGGVGVRSELRRIGWTLQARPIILVYAAVMITIITVLYVIYGQ